MDMLAWARESFAPLNLTWATAPAPRGRVRVLGHSADRSAFLDLTVRGDRVIGAALVVPVQPAYAPLATVLLAVLVAAAPRAEADAWLARALRALPQQRPGQVVRRWHQWRVELTTTAAGLLTIRMV